MSMRSQVYEWSNLATATQASTLRRTVDAVPQLVPINREYDIFIGNYPSGKATIVEARERIEKAAAERFPNADPANVAEALLPVFDPENKGKSKIVIFKCKIYCSNSLFLIFYNKPFSVRIISYKFYMI